ncbi:MAG TPA: LuxR C-terminal-related transcriptional regulator [Fimbriimonadaceae bacterium]|nr:LuxR C-terminal-related transcriptional regulator [Fimbriimonadaceae bacterium]
MEGASLNQGGSGRGMSTSLSQREQQILTYATKGLTDQAMANALGISRATVTTYWGRIRTKLGALGRTELVARYVREERGQEEHVEETPVCPGEDAGFPETYALVQRLADAAADLVYIYDLATARSLHVSTPHERMTGYADESIHPEDLAAVDAMKARLADLADGGVVEYEYRLVKRTGHIRWLRMRTTPCARRSDGSVAKVLAVATDITAERRLMARLEERLRAIAAANEELEKELAGAKSRLEERKWDLGAVSRTLEREVLRPLAGCRLAKAQAVGEISQAGLPQVSACLRQVSEAAWSAKIIAECCELLSRQPTVRREDAGEVAREVWEKLGPRGHGKVELVVSGNVMVDADRSVLAFVLRELLEGAILATRNLDKPIVAVEPFESDQGVGLAVRDNRIPAAPAPGDALSEPDLDLRARALRRLIEESGGAVLSRADAHPGFETVLVFGGL